MNDARTRRLFIGIQLSAEVRAGLERDAALLKERMRGNFSRSDNYHITLVFLGGRTDDELPALRRALDGAATFKPFELELAGMGRFSRGTRWIVWRGVAPDAPLAALYRAVCGQLRAQGVAFDAGAFNAHITLARQCTPAPLPAPGELSRGRIAVGRITMFESARVDGVLRYTPLYSRALGTAKSGEVERGYNKF